MAQKGIVTRKTRVVLNYLEEKPEVYKLQQVVLPQIDFDTLVAEMANSCGIPAPQTEAVITGALNRIVHYNIIILFRFFLFSLNATQSFLNSFFCFCTSTD